MTVSDYLFDFLVSQGIKHVFLITGGAIAFALDALHGRKDIEYICVAHEQVAAMAAEAYSRVGPGLGCAIATSGPGATNLITGICCAWFDSIPALYITGQVNTYEQRGADPGTKGSRQIGFQETDVVSIVKPVTKWAVQLDKPENIRLVLEKEVFLAKSGRPGPVLFDLPQNFQRVKIDPKKLPRFIPPKKKLYADYGTSLSGKINQTLKLLTSAQRPVLVFGTGVKLAAAASQAKILIKKIGIPVILTWGAYDLLEKTHPLLGGAAGGYGNRGANFAIQNSDLILSIGSRLDTRFTGGKPSHFGRAAKKIVVDIDKDELSKRRGLIPDIEINCDAAVFIGKLLKKIQHYKKQKIDNWLEKCADWKIRYPAVLPQYYQEKKFVNGYVFIKTLSEELDSKSIIISDDGGHLTWTMQAFEVKKGQKLFSAFGNSPMGYSFPASIGASFALGKKEVICIDGDGSIQMNIQDFQTVVHHKLPLKIFVLNNDGYAILQQFQETWLGGRFVAASFNQGLSNPDLIKVAKAYGLKTVLIRNHQELRRKIRKVLKAKGPVFCEVKINPKQRLIPKLEFGNPLEDLSPHLSREEFKANMIIPPLAESLEVSPSV